MNETKLTKEALYVPSIVFESGTLSSSSEGKVTWNGEELGGGTLDASGDITFTGLDTFTQYVTFNGGMICNSDIVLNGARLLLANGAAVEIYQGTDIPLPEGGVSNPGPGTGNSGESIDTSDFAVLSGDNEFSGNNNFTGSLTLGGKEVISKDLLTKLNTDIYWTTELNRPSGVLGFNDSTNGSRIAFNSKNHTTYPGTFSIITGNNSDESNFSLTGKPDGTLTWGGKNITRIESSSTGTNNWYIKLDNGLIIQGGTVNAYDKTLTFPTAFSNTNYAFSIFLMATEYINNDFTVAAGKTTSGITSIRMGSGNGSYGYNAGWTHSWIAMGY